MGPRKIESVRLTMDKIREEAEIFRKEHIFTSDLPVDMEHVIEATMGIYVSVLPSGGAIRSEVQLFISFIVEI